MRIEPTGGDAPANRVSADAPATSRPRRALGDAPVFSDALRDALATDGRLADLKGGLTKRQVERMLEGRPPGGFDGDFRHMNPETIRRLARFMHEQAGPLSAGERRTFAFDPTPGNRRTPEARDSERG